LSDETLFREVDEEVRRDQFRKLWDRYGNLIAAVSIAVILGVAGFKGWQYWERTQAESAGARYYEALNLQEQGKSAEAEAIFREIGSSGHSGFSMLARFQAAAALAGQGKSDEAVAAYEDIANDQSTPAQFRDVARVRAGYLLANSATPEELDGWLKAVDNPDGPWINAVREIRASAAYRTGDYLLADRLMNEIIVDPAAPQAARQRAQMMVQLLAPLLAGKKEAAEKPAGQ